MRHELLSQEPSKSSTVPQLGVHFCRFYLLDFKTKIRRLTDKKLKYMDMPSLSWSVASILVTEASAQAPTLPSLVMVNLVLNIFPTQ